MSLDQVRAVADAVLYEGYLLYPYRATSRKNQVRWQFGVLGPPGAAEQGIGEEPGMSTQCLLTRGTGAEPGALSGDASVSIHLRFLHLQERRVERYDGRGGRFVPVDELAVGEHTWLSWDEAVEHEVVLDLSAEDVLRGDTRKVAIAGHRDVEGVEDVEDVVGGDGVAGRVVRRRWPLQARVTVSGTTDEGFTRLEVGVDNLTQCHASDPAGRSRDPVLRGSLIGTHLVMQVHGARFVSLVDPPTAAKAPAERCRQHRCWPVLAGEHPRSTSTSEGLTSSIVLASPIILYDFPQVADQSAGALFDSTEIDEILTLRVMTMTEQEKAEARATDPRAREIIDRCGQMSPPELQRLHGILRNPHALPPEPGRDTIAAADIRNAEPPTFGDAGVPWWDPAGDEAVRPEADSVVIGGVAVSKGSLVRVHPSRRADAQDLFFAGQVARVTAVLSDVDGGVHVALVLVDDPAADLHDWYGRYWYFDPDELEPLTDDQPHARAANQTVEHREESRS